MVTTRTLLALAAAVALVMVLSLLSGCGLITGKPEKCKEFSEVYWSCAVRGSDCRSADGRWAPEVCCDGENPCE